MGANNSIREGLWMQSVVMLNLMVVAIQPLVLLGLLFLSDSFQSLPPWGYGIVLSWAFYLPLWSLFAVARDERPPRLRQTGFLFTSFVHPVAMAVAMGDSLVMVGLDLSTFHTLGIGLAFGMALILGPFACVEVKEMRLTRFRLRGFREVLEVTNPFPIILLISAILFAVVTLPPIAAELAFFQRAERPLWFWIGRYVTLIPEVVVIFGLLLPKTIYGLSASR